MMIISISSLFYETTTTGCLSHFWVEIIFFCKIFVLFSSEGRRGKRISEKIELQEELNNKNFIKKLRENVDEIASGVNFI